MRVALTRAAKWAAVMCKLRQGRARHAWAIPAGSVSARPIRLASRRFSGSLKLRIMSQEACVCVCVCVCVCGCNCSCTKTGTSDTAGTFFK